MTRKLYWRKIEMTAIARKLIKDKITSIIKAVLGILFAQAESPGYFAKASIYIN